jgi:hypothetical protein
MAYIINRYDGTRLIVLDDGILDTTIPVGLVGRNYTGWGEVFNENFVFLAENFKGTSPPPRALEGQAWYDSIGKVLKAYDGDKWNPIGNAEVSETAPNPTKGGLWLKSTTDQLYVSVDNEWKLVGPEGLEGFGTTRIKSEVLSDRSGQPYPVSISYVDDQPISIFSAYKFELLPDSISGFSSIEVGLNFRSDSLISGNLKGNSDTATALKIPRNINGVQFDGTQNIIIRSSTTNPLKKGDYIVGSDWDGTLEDTWSVDATPENRIGKVVARDANGEFSAERITANLTGNVAGNVTALSGTSAFSNITATRITAPDFIGNASTVTRLRTPRKINTVDFDGTEDITLPVPAETLVGNALAPNVISSSLTSIGKLISLDVEDTGLLISNNDSGLRFFLNGFTPTIRSELSNQIKLELLTGSSQSTISDISYISAASTSLVGVSGPSLVPDWNKAVPDNQKINLGLPNNQWNTVFSNNFQGRDLRVDTINSESGQVRFLGSVSVAGAVSGELVGNLTGNVTGNLTGNVTGAASLNALKSGDNFTGDLGWLVSGRGVTWSAFTDNASIKFYTTGDTDQDTRLEFNTGDNGNEYFLFSHTYAAGNKINLMRLDPNDNFGDVRMSVYGNIEATGRVIANRFIGIGTDLTNIDAGKISQGRIPNPRLSGSYDISVSGNASTVSSITGTQVTSALGYTPANVSGSSLSGDWNWFSTARGLNWAMNTDGASIRFYNLGDGDTDSRLEFETRDNGNEYFRWTHTLSGSGNFECMRLIPNGNGNSVLTVRGNIVSTNSISAVNFSGSGSGITNLTASNISSGTVPVGRLSGTYNISITGNAASSSTATTATNVSGGFANVSSASVNGVLNVSAGISGGIRFPNDAFGGGGDTARITLETKGGEATTLTFRVTNDADDTIGFFAPSNNGLTMNNNIVLHAGNYNNYSPARNGSGAFGTWPINITGQAGTVGTISSGQVISALGYVPANGSGPGVINGEQNYQFNLLRRPTVIDYAMYHNALGSRSGSVSVDCTQGNYVSVTAVGAINWSFINPPTGLRATGIILELTNGGAYTQNWPSSIRWPSATAPVLSSSGVDVLIFITDDAGANWRGAISMSDSR